MSPVTDVVAQPATDAAPAKPTARMALDHGQLTRALKIAEFGVCAKSPVEAQRGVLVEAGRSRATLTTFDYETAVSVAVPGSAGTGSSLLHFTQLKKALAAMVAGETKAQAERTSVSLAGDLLSTEHLTVPVAALELEEFTRPPEPVPAMATVDAGEFFAELRRVLPAAGRDDTLPVLTAVHLVLAGQELTMAATDRYRLAEGRVRAEATVRPPDKPLSVLFPADVLTALLKQFKSYDGPVGVGLLSEDSSDIPRATLSLGDTTVTVRAREGKFPVYSAFFPTEFVASVRMDRATLVRAAKKGLAMVQAVGGTHSPVALRWNAEAALSLAPVIGTPAEQARVKGMSVPFTLTRGAAEDVAGMSVHFKPAFLLAALDAFTGQESVTLHIREFEEGQSRKPVLLASDRDDDGYRHLLMPVRVDPPK
ncbi:DNA polymerase III subunit beta [Streptomyces sp. NPDC001795]|uniref:DNA polymerase III subunit beta n=1 Tax=Streptomyces sp. NPDC001795 TaxID=3154525 RepID=UPI00332A1BC7